MSCAPSSSTPFPGAATGAACTTGSSTTRGSRAGTDRVRHRRTPPSPRRGKRWASGTARPFGGPGLNHYRDGNDSVAFHRDRELRQLTDTMVAVLTLGARRPFLVRPHGGGRSIDLSPASGDLLVMGGRCQLDWEHGVPKVAAAGARVSVSWRWTNRDGAHTIDPHPEPAVPAGDPTHVE